MPTLRSPKAAPVQQLEKYVASHSEAKFTHGIGQPGKRQPSSGRGQGASAWRELPNGPDSASAGISSLGRSQCRSPQTKPARVHRFFDQLPLSFPPWHSGWGFRPRLYHFVERLRLDVPQRQSSQCKVTSCLVVFDPTRSPGIIAPMTGNSGLAFFKQSCRPIMGWTIVAHGTI